MAAGKADDYEQVPSVGQLVKGEEEFAIRILREWAEPVTQRRSLSVERVARAAAEALKIDLKDMRGARRFRDLSFARAVVGYVGREQGRIPLTITAEYFGRDGSTLVRDLRRLEDRLSRDRRIRAAITAVLRQLEIPHSAGIQR